MPRRDRPDAVLVMDIIAAAEDALDFVAGLDAELVAELREKRRAILHALAEIGEAAGRLSPEFRARVEEIPWSAVIAIRHRIIHEYAEVDFDVVWRIVQDELPRLVAALRRTLPAAG